MAYVFLFVGHGAVQMWTRVYLCGATVKIKIHFSTEPQLKSSFIFCIVSESSVLECQLKPETARSTFINNLSSTGRFCIVELLYVSGRIIAA